MNAAHGSNICRRCCRVRLVAFYVHLAPLLCAVSDRTAAFDCALDHVAARSKSEAYAISPDSLPQPSQQQLLYLASIYS